MGWVGVGRKRWDMLGGLLSTGGCRSWVGQPYPDSSPEGDRGIRGEEEAPGSQGTATMVTGW